MEEGGSEWMQMDGWMDGPMDGWGLVGLPEEGVLFFVLGDLIFDYDFQYSQQHSMGFEKINHATGHLIYFSGWGSSGDGSGQREYNPISNHHLDSLYYLLR